MTVLFVTPYLRKRGEMPKGGGLEAYVLRVAGALGKLGHTPIVLASGASEVHYYEDGIEFFFIKCHFPINFGNSVFGMMCQKIEQSWEINREIAGLLKKREIDIIQFPQTFGTAACYFKQTPAVMRLSSYAKTCFVDSYTGIQLRIESFLERLGAKRCNSVFAPSYVVADAFSKDIHRKVSVIESPFWNDAAECDNSIYQEKLSGKKYVLFIGRLSIEKGIVEMTEVIYRFFEANPDYFLVCCGDDDSINGRSTLHALKKAAECFKERVIHLKTMPHETLYPVIQHADFVICPSRMENLSNACMEAMYFGRVVIGTNGTSYEQLIKDGVNGLLCRPKNPKDLLDKMNKAAAMSKAEKASMGKNAQKMIERLAPKYTVNELLRYYQYVIDNVKGSKSK